ncbi:MAG TPA: hypothetical protein VK590_10715 [Saprospiraceae bacterium]|nr:hypothetical protein [Saprospiraceae bacterium]
MRMNDAALLKRIKSILDDNLPDEDTAYQIRRIFSYWGGSVDDKEDESK